MLSLRKNNIRELGRNVIGATNNGYDMDEVYLLHLDLSSNLFKEFPWKALHLQKKLKVLDMSRNKIESIP